MMTKREVIRATLNGEKPPYVPWSFSFTLEAREKLERHFGTQDLETVLHNHLLGLGNDIGFFDDLGNDRVRDVFGVVWDRSVDKDIGITESHPLAEPTLANYEFPDASLFTLFSSGGEDCLDLPETSNYREVTPRALSLRWRGGVTSLTPFAIDWARYNDSALNRFLA